MHCQYSSGHHYIKTSACNKAWPYIKTGLVKTLHLSCEATHMGYRLKFSEKKLLLAGSFEKSPSPLPVDGALSLPNPLPPIWKLLDVIIQKHRRGRWSLPSTMASATTSGLVRLVHCLGIIFIQVAQIYRLIESRCRRTMSLDDRDYQVNYDASCCDKSCTIKKYHHVSTK